ncbi:hypothetical protein ACQ5SK_08250 [Bradyrhizobium japonicum]
MLAFDLERNRVAGMRGGGRSEEERGGGDGELVHDNLRKLCRSELVSLVDEAWFDPMPGLSRLL